jgi:hypothetical protein
MKRNGKSKENSKLTADFSTAAAKYAASGRNDDSSPEDA